MSEIDRRAFLGTLPAAFVVGRDSLGDGARPRMRDLSELGVQLYTLRSALQEDVDRTLAAVAEIGYTKVEIAGLYGHSPREMRAKLDAVGLRCASSHHGLADVRGDWAAVLEGAQELGQDLIVVPSIPSDENTPDLLARVADDFNRAGEVAQAAGIRFGYHNHDWEFEPHPNGVLPMDLLLERTDPHLVDWQLDLFWIVHGGADPVRYLRATAGRVTSVHVKDRTADGGMVDVGQGVIDFATLLPLAEGLGLRHAFVEHDSPGDPIESVRRSYEHLRSLEP